MPPKIKKELLITGCGRSGTKYISFVLRRIGLHVNHEHIGRDGIASWLMAVDSDRTPWGPGRANYCFQHVFHQVRDPLRAIPSIETFKQSSWTYINHHIDLRGIDHPRLRAATYWYYWNLKVEEFAEWRYRVEAIDTVFAEMCQRLGRDTNVELLAHVPTDINTRSRGRIFHWYEELCERLNIRSLRPGHPKLADINPESKCTWKDLEQLDPKLSKMIYEKAVQYGYRYE